MRGGNTASRAAAQLQRKHRWRTPAQGLAVFQQEIAAGSFPRVRDMRYPTYHFCFRGEKPTTKHQLVDTPEIIEIVMWRTPLVRLYKTRPQVIRLEKFDSATTRMFMADLLPGGMYSLWNDMIHSGSCSLHYDDTGRIEALDEGHTPPWTSAGVRTQGVRDNALSFQLDVLTLGKDGIRCPGRLLAVAKDW